ncbi:MAG: hypothetical protein ABGZ19_03140 [Verrucomicrobiales bacterium]
MANFALSVRSDEGKGGTWAGATENLKNRWVPMFVKPNSDASGNVALIGRGAVSLNSPQRHTELANWLVDELNKEIVIGPDDTMNLF